ncbi:MAG TPA: hypothetical protein VGQ46_02280 [Thermoanaerobaculia bacterium]|jgi:hypothetical protein|nr:hypothetical protein [Thermoanaerobaculia bacterium]
MGRRKTPISGASSYRKIGDFWDQHDLADYSDQTYDIPIEYGDITDQELLAAADVLFVMYDEEERQKSEIADVFIYPKANFAVGSKTSVKRFVSIPSVLCANRNVRYECGSGQMFETSYLLFLFSPPPSSSSS